MKVLQDRDNIGAGLGIRVFWSGAQKKHIRFTSEKNVFIPVNHSMIKIEICADFREILGKSVTIFFDRYVFYIQGRADIQFFFTGGSGLSC